MRPANGMLLAISDAELLAMTQKALPLVASGTLELSVAYFRRICRANGVVILRATPDDERVINSRDAIGWSDDRP